MRHTIATALAKGRVCLQQHSEAKLETEVLLSDILRVPRSYLRAFTEKQLTLEQEEKYLSGIERLLHGEPLAYITGWKEFWGLKLHVTPATLIPRPETEILVEQVLSLFGKHTELTVADIGTGSGAIALALASVRPTWQVIATDISAQAMQIAEENAQQWKISNITCLIGDGCAPLGNQLLDVIVSNPPYIMAGDPHLDALTYEPKSALVGGSDGLQFIKQIVREAVHNLKPDGCMIVEHGFNQGTQVRDIFAQNGYIKVKTQTDYAGLERITLGYMHRNC